MSNSTFINQLLNPAVQDFIIQHENDDENLLILKHKEILGIPSMLIVQQIIGRRKAKLKLPSFYIRNIIFPPKLNLEQCSSERTGEFKAGLISGKSALDLTGGFGVDSLFLSKNFKRVIHVEPSESLVEIVRHNHNILGATNIVHHCTDAQSFLGANNDHFDLIYIDPSRRSSTSRKVFKFADCSPNVVDLLPLLLERSKAVLIKASPLIDIQQCIRELGSVSKIYVVGFENECKEVLVLVTLDNQGPQIEAIELLDPLQSFSFLLSEEGTVKTEFSEPLQFLYEPNAMILKAGAFKLIAKRYALKKLATNTHLYTSTKLISQFPGRCFEVESFLKSDPKSILDALPGGYANIITRNYPLTPVELKKKLKLQDGGEKFIIGFSSQQKKYLVLASRIK